MLKGLIKRYIIFIDQNNRLLIKMLIQKFESVCREPYSTSSLI